MPGLVRAAAAAARAEARAFDDSPSGLSSSRIPVSIDAYFGALSISAVSFAAFSIESSNTNSSRGACRRPQPPPHFAAQEAAGAA